MIALWLFHRTSISRFFLISAVMVVTVVLLSSCNSMHRFYNDYSVDPLQYDKAKTFIWKLAGNCTGDSKQPSDGKAVCNYCIDGSDLNDNQKTLCSYQRDLVIGDLIGISDGMCDTHVRTIYGNEAALNITAGTFTNAFSGAATVIAGEVPKSVLSALAFFSNSERSLINETVYKSVIVPAIVKKINESRQASRRNILQKYEAYRSGDYKKYPVNIALLDVIEYHQTCSFMFGLQKALDEGVQNTKERDIGFLEQKRYLLAIQYDARRMVLKNQSATAEEISSDPLSKGLKSQIEALNDQIAQLQKQDTSTSSLQKTAQELTFTGQVTAVDTTNKIIKVKEASDEKIFVWEGAADTSTVTPKPGDKVSIKYVQQQDGKYVAKNVDITDVVKP